MTAKLARWFAFTLLVGTLAYLRLPAFAAPRTPPQITHFSASSQRITSGEALTLNWQLAGDPAPSVALTTLEGKQLVTGHSLTLEPRLSDTYTLVTENRQGSAQRELRVAVYGNVLASAAPVAAAEDASGGAKASSEPEGTLGIGTDPEGPFVNDEAGSIDGLNDERVVRVTPGGTFYVQVSFRDPDGIQEIDINLVNSAPAGLAGGLSPERPPFTVVGAPSGDCPLGQLPTAVTCRYTVQVAADARNISALPGAGGEFAYVFRVRVVDGLGNAVNRPVRGYVAVTAQ